MDRKIIVYGLGDKSEEARLRNDKELEEWIKGGIFDDERCRFRYTQNKKADIIVLSRDGRAFGHFKVAPEVIIPNPEDLKAYPNPKVKAVYLVRESVLYENKVRLRDLGISRYQFGKSISEAQFKEIQRLAETRGAGAGA